MTRALRAVMAAVLAVTLGLAAYTVIVRTGGRWSVDGPLALAAQALAMPLFAAVGAVILHRRPGHRLGWLLLVVGTLGAVNEALRGYVETQPLPIADASGAVAVVVARALGTPVFVALTIILPLLFPDGDVPSRRWRPVLWSLLALLAVGWVPDLFASGPVEWFIEDRHVVVVERNPLGIPALGEAPEVLGDVTSGLSILWMVAAIAALVVRARRDVMERFQIKWVALALVGGIVCTFLTAIPGFESEANTLSSLAFLTVPVAVGIAITRYRLYDIDRIVSRTLSYAVVTALLVGVYATGVLGVGALLPGEPSDLLVAGSTLAVAALFRPLRSRIQSVVDRRFNRSRYDAARTIEAFGARLRDEVDLGSLSGELRDAVATTVQPRSISVWLRQGAG